MPHPHSPQQPDSAELAGSLAVQPSKDQSCAPIPLHPPTPLSSPPRSAASSAMVTVYSEPAPPQEPIAALMTMNDSSAMPWPSSHEDFPSTITDGPDFNYPMQFTQGPHSPGLYDYGHNTAPFNENYHLTYSAPLNLSCPRSYMNGVGLTGLRSSNMSQSYPPGAYQIEPQSHDAIDFVDQGVNGQLLELRQDDYGTFSPMINHEEQHSAYTSPYDSDVTRSSTPSGDYHGLPLDYKIECEEGAVDKEQPYAQLIHRALMEAPGHTMILRDIYEWFRSNTDKAADKETKGWQNSIRHNLSMNGAFEKVDSPCEESGRGFMWRLTDEAVRDGVKSTTRYRSKQPNKRAHRSSNPLPQRQASGAKGGQAARRAARRRVNTRMNMPEHPSYRSVPTGVASVFDTESLPLHSTPYYGSPTISESEFDEYSKEGASFNTASTLGVPSSSLELFAPRNYNANIGSPFTQNMPPCGDTAYIQEPINGADPMIFANSPSSTADEPRTPDSQLGGGWGDDMLMGGGMHGGGVAMVYDAPYNEFAV
ncbi:hypothetical protein P280DRAFT_545928 [Massarina eburnea CBS 473.64]|uniref:Fork-head domain-containing protein n=1 Tax=Massarina eburnea CBS 473.64 TaxID=1395130 RepID=A0A6A6SB28_9PLEO|nr:hypothetical protein P280DRAFT_545928 [Massarina eburnea CBS 473.64]